MGRKFCLEESVMDYQALAQLLFPDVTETPEQLEEARALFEEYFDCVFVN